MANFGLVGGLLVADNPLETARIILRHLVGTFQAQGGVVLVVVRERDLAPFANQDVTVDALAATQAAWRRSVQVLQQGQALHAGDLLVFPVREMADPDAPVVGLVMLDQAAHTETEGLGQFEPPLAAAIQAHQRQLRVPAAQYLASASSDEVERTHLLIALERNGWNITRVSELLGVTRRAVYLRLQRFGLQRKRRPKGRQA